jgi:hypothetical protein
VNLSVKDLVGVVELGVTPLAARDELERRARDGDPEAEQAIALLDGSDVPPADDPEYTI